MKRRAALAGTGVAVSSVISGCTGWIPGMGLSTEFEEVDVELPVDDPPDVTVDDNTVIARGTIEYGSSTCGKIELAHAGYERSQRRLDLLVVAADDSGLSTGCTEDLVQAGYQVEATVNDALRRISVTEHHVFGETYSTTVDLTDW